ncbi:hypothetical protein H8L32_16905 [Undibacterium sp. CY18W]|uniref:Uncharacterized protein n=1 Tax=Undibacterium hunanense TaxID=2762292 RepID=A0ABR6ZTJ2_9BURK|nr:hypothetical protein [Undibacterium hunanense]MBC3919174.1 hypothetical protein [Undibacterium hunanense]
MATPVSVCIEIDEDGNISVGTQDSASVDSSLSSSSPAMGMGTDASSAENDTDGTSGMQPADSIDQALAVARELLRNAAQAGAATIGGEPGGEGAQDAADAAFKSRRGDKAGF